MQGSQAFKEAQESSGGVFSERKRVIHRDSVVLKAAQDRVKAGDCTCLSSMKVVADGFLPSDQAADAILIRHFSALSEKFAVPLNRYFASLQPLAKCESFLAGYHIMFIIATQ